MTKKISCIYAITNLVNGKRYIGSTNDFDRRVGQHRWHLNRNTHSNAILQQSWNKHGASAFTFGVLSTQPDVDGLLMSEQAWLDCYAPEYNIAKSSSSPTLGLKMSKASKARMSAAQKKVVRPPELLARLARMSRERVRSPEERARIGDKNRGRPNPHKGKKRSKEFGLKVSAGLKGKPLSESHKEALRQAKLENPVRYWKGKKRYPETCEKISKAQLGRKHSEKTKAKRSESVTKWWATRVGDDRKWRKNQ